MKTVRVLISLLERSEQRRLVRLLLASVGVAAISVASIAIFGPFMRLVAAPEAVREGLTGAIYSLLGFSEPQRFLIVLGGAAFLLILLGNFAKAAMLHGIHRFVADNRCSLSLRLFRRYVSQPWAFHIERNSSRLSQGLLNEVDNVVNNVLRPAMDAVSQGAVVAGILLFLLATSPLVAVTAAFVLAVAYSTIYVSLRPRLAQLGREHWDTNGERFGTAGEAFSVMKELKVLQLEERYRERYAAAAGRHARAEMWVQTISTVPRHLLEAIAFGMIIVLILVLLAVEGTMSSVLPVLAIYALAAYRLMPALQIVYGSVTQARFFAHTVMQLHRDMQHLTDRRVAHTEDNSPASGVPSVSQKSFRSLRLDHVSFCYRGTGIDVLEDLTLEIRRNELVAFVGTTGCGKTTLVDIVLGLLEPTDGSLFFNGEPVTQPTHRRGRFGYVPQEIFIADTSIAGNIALGIPAAEIDQRAVERAARTANLHDFIVGELPAGYQTLTGERGVRLSGGQRQRLGIARALYLDPEILVLDEATNALDTVTEDAVMNAVSALHHRKTIILIAHRLSTVERSDRIYLLERGRIAAVGTYRELLAVHAGFQAFAGGPG